MRQKRLTGAGGLGVVPSLVGADDGVRAGEDGARLGAVVEVDPSVCLPPALSSHHLLHLLLPTPGPVAHRQSGEVPGVSLAVDQPLAPPPVAPAAGVLVHGPAVLAGVVGDGTAVVNAWQSGGVTGPERGTDWD